MSGLCRACHREYVPTRLEQKHCSRACKQIMALHRKGELPDSGLVAWRNGAVLQHTNKRSRELKQFAAKCREKEALA